MPEGYHDSNTRKSINFTDKIVHNMRTMDQGWYSPNQNVGRGLNMNQKDYAWMGPYSSRESTMAGKRADLDKLKLAPSACEILPSSTSDLQTSKKEREIDIARTVRSFNLSTIV